MNLFELIMNQFLEIILFVFILSSFFGIICFFLIRNTNKKEKEFKEKQDRETSPKYASQLRNYRRTVDEGDFAVCLNKDNWVIVQWKKKGPDTHIVIFTPPRHEDRTNLIHKQWFNGQMEEVQEVRIEDLPRIS